MTDFDTQPDDPQPSSRQAATVRKSRSFRLPGIWLVPVVAGLIALYLGYLNYSNRGPDVTISFNSAEGIVAGQTQVRYKAVSLGTVTGFKLGAKTRQVKLRVRMSKASEPYLTDHARFWVVKPRIGAGSLSGVETLISGAYIQCDPGAPGGKPAYSFNGLEDPPGRSYDEPGKIYVLRAQGLGSVNKGTAIYFRDIAVGEVLSYNIGDGFGPMNLTIFIHSPYDKFVRPGTRFWNASGFGVNIGPTGLHVQLQSLQSVLSGGIDFMTPLEQRNFPPVPEKTIFTLYPDQASADASAPHKRVPYITYFQSSVKNLAVGASVTLYGIPVGKVLAVTLLVDPKTASGRVRVDYEIESELIFGISPAQTPDVLELTRKFVANGLRAKLVSASLLTGQQLISLEFVPNAKPATVVMSNASIVMPAGPVGGLDGVTDAMADVAAKLDQIPFAQIGENLNKLLAHADQTIAGPDMRNALHSLAATLAQAQSLVQKADRGITPALARLPELSAQLQQAATHANGAFASIDEKSDFQREARRTMSQVDDAARSIGLLADFLNRHPEALVRGRATKGSR